MVAYAAHRHELSVLSPGRTRRELLRSADTISAMTPIESGAPSGSGRDSPVGSIGKAEADVIDTAEAGSTALHGGVLRTGAYVLSIILSLVSVRVLFAHLGLVNFERYVVVISLVTVVGGLAEGGLNSVVVREFATLGGERRLAMMRSAVGIRLVVTLIGVGIAVGFAIAAKYGQTLVLGTALAGVGLLLQLLQSTFAVTLQAQLRFGWVSTIEVARQVVNVSLLIALALAGAGLLPLLAVAIPASGVALALTIPLVRGHTSLAPSFHIAHWWRLLRESVPWAMIAAVNILYFRLPLLLMSLIAGSVQTGYFATSFRIIEVLVGIPALIISAAFPILARAERDDTSRFRLASGRIFELAVLAGTWIVLCLEMGAGFAVHVLAGNEADPSIAVLRIQGIALLATFVSVACGYPLLTLRRYRVVLLINIGALILSAALTVALVPSQGAQGAAIAGAAAESALAVSSAIFLARDDRRVRLPLGAPIAAGIAGAAGAACGLALPIQPVLGALLASLVYFALLRLLGRFPPEARELLLRSLRGILGSGRGRSNLEPD